MSMSTIRFFAYRYVVYGDTSRKMRHECVFILLKAIVLYFTTLHNKIFTALVIMLCNARVGLRKGHKWI